MWFLAGLPMNIFNNMPRNLSFTTFLLCDSLEIFFKNFVRQWTVGFLSHKYISSKNLVFVFLSLLNSFAFFIKKIQVFIHISCPKVLCCLSSFNWLIPFSNEMFGIQKVTFFCLVKGISKPLTFHNAFKLCYFYCTVQIRVSKKLYLTNPKSSSLETLAAHPHNLFLYSVLKT